MKLTRAFLSSALLGIALIANAVPLKTDLARSSVSAVFKQMNVPVESSFKRFDARIDYDAAHPEKASARVDIDTASFDMGQAAAMGVVTVIGTIVVATLALRLIFKSFSGTEEPA